MRENTAFRAYQHGAAISRWRNAERPHLRMFLTLLSVVLILIGSGVFTATEASAATCQNSSCNNRDPQATGCSASAGDLDSFTWQGVYVQLRLSNPCHAAWTRGSTPNCSVGGYISIEAYYDAAATRWAGTSSEVIPCGGSGTTAVSWTNMFSFYYYVRACITINGVRVHCSATH